MLKISPAKFVREVRNEFKKIHWPNRKEILMSTVMVFIMVIIVSLLFFAVDGIIFFLLSLVPGF